MSDEIFQSCLCIVSFRWFWLVCKVYTNDTVDFDSLLGFSPINLCWVNFAVDNIIKDNQNKVTEPCPIIW